MGLDACGVRTAITQCYIGDHFENSRRTNETDDGNDSGPNAL